MNYYAFKLTEKYIYIWKGILLFRLPAHLPWMVDIADSCNNALHYSNACKTKEGWVEADFANISEINKVNPLTDSFIVKDIKKQYLGHFTERWNSLYSLKNILKPDEVLIATIRNLRVFRGLPGSYFQRNLPYASSKLQNKSYVKFFNKINSQVLVNNTDFGIEKNVYAGKTCQLQKRRGLSGKLSFGIFDLFLVQQCIVTARNIANEK